MSGPSVTDHLIDDFHVILGVLDIQGEPEISALLLEAAHETALGPELAGEVLASAVGMEEIHRPVAVVHRF